MYEKQEDYQSVMPQSWESLPTNDTVIDSTGEVVIGGLTQVLEKQIKVRPVQTLCKPCKVKF